MYREGPCHMSSRNFEEVLVHGQNPALAKAISDRTDVPLATGVRMFTIEEFRSLGPLQSIVFSLIYNKSVGKYGISAFPRNIFP